MLTLCYPYVLISIETKSKLEDSKAATVVKEDSGVAPTVICQLLLTGNLFHVHIEVEV